MKLIANTIPALMIGSLLVSCGEKENTETTEQESMKQEAPAAQQEDHGDHAHDEVALGEYDISGYNVKAAQGHGHVEAGKESHLVITLPFNDKGETVVRAWIGTEDRTLSSVGKGAYAPSHDD